MRKFLVVVGVAVFVLILLRGVIYRTVVSYKIVSARQLGGFSKDGDRQASLLWADLKKNARTERVIDRALQATADRLSFAADHASTDPTTLLLQNDRAHCVGYAALCAALCNSGLQYVDHPPRGRCEQVVARIHLFGHEVHPYFQSAFFRDHDICIMVDGPGDTIAVDPVVYDLFGIDRIRLR